MTALVKAANVQGTSRATKLKEWMTGGHSGGNLAEVAYQASQESRAGAVSAHPSPWG